GARARGAGHPGPPLLGLFGSKVDAIAPIARRAGRSRPPRVPGCRSGSALLYFPLDAHRRRRPARVARHTLCVSCESPWLLDPRSGEGEFSGNGSRTHRELATPSRVFGSDCQSTVANPQTDVQAMVNGFASVTPLNAALTTSGTSGASASSCPADPP